MNVGANYLREHIPSNVRLHYAYTDCGGVSPNVVPETAEVMYYVRAPKIRTARAITERLNKIAQGAAMMTETSLTWTVDSEMLDYIPNHTLNRVLDLALREGSPAFQPAEPYLPLAECRPISTDVGNVSYLVPTGQIYTACFIPGTVYHTRPMESQAGSAPAQEGMLAAAAAMARAAAYAAEDPEILRAAKAEWEESLRNENFS